MHKSFLSCQPVPISWAPALNHKQIWEDAGSEKYKLHCHRCPAQPALSPPVSRWALRVPGCHPTSSVKWNIKKQTQRQGLVLWSIRLEWLGDTLLMDVLWTVNSLEDEDANVLTSSVRHPGPEVTSSWCHQRAVSSNYDQSAYCGDILISWEREERVSAWCY